ncbi:MAG TPA: flagellar basal-body MS-ring/collar protein FliF [Bryobacteraceae bacterium]
MDQIKKLLSALTLQQKIALGLAIVLVASALPAFIHWQHERDFRPLFTGMSPEDAGAVVQKIKESGVEHRLTNNGTTVEVPAEKVDEVRLELAGAGLPKSGRIGFELFDKTNIGLTDFGERVNYRRAIEGELERSVKALSAIEAARVHVSFPKDSVFLDAREPAKASVLVRLRPGAALAPQNVTAITNLVASAVEGLSPEFVSVVDMRGNLLSRPRKTSPDASDSADALLEYKHQVEKDLTAKVESTLEPLLGEGRFRIGVSAECDLSTTEQTDETFDPTKSVMASSQKSEDLAGSGGAGGVPGTPSNLPRSTIRPMVAGPGSTVSRRTENTTFETSRTVRQVKMPRGSIKRISAALLLDQDMQWQGKGAARKRVPVPPSAERLKAIHDVVAGVLGIAQERGDQLVIESLPFEQTRMLDDNGGGATKPPVEPLFSPAKLLRDRRVWMGGGAALVLLAGLVFVMRKKKKKVSIEEAPAALPAGHSGKEGTGRTPAGTVEAAAAVAEMTPGKPYLPPITSKAQGLLVQIQETVARDPAFAANVVRGWMEED